jgi:hypothetical protein
MMLSIVAMLFVPLRSNNGLSGLFSWINAYRPVRSNGPETHAKQSAFSHAFDLWRVF